MTRNENNGGGKRGFHGRKWFNSNFKNQIIFKEESLHQIEASFRALYDMDQILNSFVYVILNYCGVILKDE